MPDEGDRIRDANLLVLSVENTGSEPITADDYIPPIKTVKFVFPRKEIISVTNVRTEPTPGLLTKDDVSLSLRGSVPGHVRFHIGPTLNKGASIILNILTKETAEGTAQNISHHGDLIGGKIHLYQPPRPMRRKVAISATGGLMVIATLLFLLLHVFYSPFSSNPNCPSDSLTIGGSTALLPLVEATALSYKVVCSHAIISTSNSNIASSKAGLSALKAGTIQIGDSDLLSSNLSLVDHPVAAVTYVMIINQNVPQVTNLSTAQIQGIYDGSLTTWDKVGSNSQAPIYVVNRTTTSGSRATFENYVLGKDAASHVLHPMMDDEEDTSKLLAQKVANTPGAIGYIDQRDATITPNVRTLTIDGITASPGNVKSNAYKFWSIEHMYTQSNPSDLTNAFLQYITGKNNYLLVNNLGYVPFHEMPPATLQEHPSPTAPDSL